MMPAHRAMPAPLRCYWELTRACDHACMHCRVDAGVPRERELSRAEALSVAAQLAAMRVPRVVLSGGEPTLCAHWLAVSEKLAAGGGKVSLFTGRQLTDAEVDAALEAGVTDFLLSVDGPEEVHDALRPPRTGQASTWVGTMDMLQRLITRGIPLRVVTTVNRVNLPYLRSLYGTLRDLGVTGWQVQLCQGNGRAHQHRATLLPEPQGLKEIVDVLLLAARERQIHAPLHCTLGYLTEEEVVLRHPRSRRPLPWAGTGAGLRTMAITSDGRVSGCTCLPDTFAIASLRARSLQEIWADDESFPYSRRWHPKMLDGACGHCVQASTCRAGCPAVAFGATGAMGANPYCLLQVRRDRAGR